jgi:putative addiction module component (TIGR02574 family)
MSVLNDLRPRALELSRADRAALARDLLLSLETEDAERDPDYEASLAAEIEDRARAVEEGRVTLLSREEFEARIRGSLVKGRQQQPPAEVGGR